MFIVFVFVLFDLAVAVAVAALVGVLLVAAIVATIVARCDQNSPRRFHVKGPMCEPRVMLLCLLVGLSLYKPCRKSTGKKNLAIILQNISARRDGASRGTDR